MTRGETQSAQSRPDPATVDGACSTAATSGSGQCVVSLEYFPDKASVINNKHLAFYQREDFYLVTLPCAIAALCLVCCVLCCTLYAREGICHLFDFPENLKRRGTEHFLSVDEFLELERRRQLGLPCDSLLALEEQRRAEALGEEPPEALGEEAPEAPGEEAPEASGEEAPEAPGEEAPEALGEEAPEWPTDQPAPTDVAEPMTGGEAPDGGGALPLDAEGEGEVPTEAVNAEGDGEAPLQNGDGTAATEGSPLRLSSASAGSGAGVTTTPSQQGVPTARRSVSLERPGVRGVGGEEDSGHRSRLSARAPASDSALQRRSVGDATANLPVRSSTNRFSADGRPRSSRGYGPSLSHLVPEDVDGRPVEDARYQDLAGQRRPSRRSDAYAVAPSDPALSRRSDLGVPWREGVAADREPPLRPPGAQWSDGRPALDEQGFPLAQGRRSLILATSTGAHGPVEGGQGLRGRQASFTPLNRQAVGSARSPPDSHAFVTGSPSTLGQRGVSAAGEDGRHVILTPSGHHLYHPDINGDMPLSVSDQILQHELRAQGADPARYGSPAQGRGSLSAESSQRQLSRQYEPMAQDPDGRVRRYPDGERDPRSYEYPLRGPGLQEYEYPYQGRRSQQYEYSAQEPSLHGYDHPVRGPALQRYEEPEFRRYERPDRDALDQNRIRAFASYDRADRVPSALLRPDQTHRPGDASTLTLSQIAVSRRSLSGVPIDARYGPRHDPRSPGSSPGEPAAAGRSRARGGGHGRAA
ncbi:uncharacterized protein LOC119108131 [Pollicipes pollicipes]|uniref:uncharacterized protein LOC119108131 n=1 Tax=Pollicipes pollicipes TaxID=41117 RepID=UPI0018854936|nr:uncharacterized protein LOC119108131 [Pollicipes pollicipes]